MKRAATALSLIAMLAVAGPAAAKPKYYSGTTDDGDRMAFTLKGKRISNIDGYIRVTCVPTSGVPRTNMTEFAPTGSFRLGKTRKTKLTKHVDWWGDTTFHYKVGSKKVGRNKWKVKLHLNFSYVQFSLPGGGQVDQTGYVCQGDDSFTFKA